MLKAQDIPSDFVLDTLEISQINFRHNKTDYDSLYTGNSYRLQYIKSVLNELIEERPENIVSIVVEGTASPVGSVALNKTLSGLRADTLKSHLATSDHLHDFNVRTVGKGEDWATLEEEVTRSYHFDNRDELLGIIGSGFKSNDKKALIRSMDGTTWQHLVDNYMDNTRRAMTVVVVLKRRLVDYLPMVEPLAARAESARLPLAEGRAPADEPTVTQEDTSNIFAHLHEEFLLFPEYYSKVSPFAEYYHRYYRRGEKREKPLDSSSDVPVASLRTNLLITGLNFGAEVPLGNHCSIAADYYFPWFWPDKRNKDCFEFIGVNAEIRYWFGRDRQPSDRLRGHSLGFYFAGGYFDFEKNYRGMQGEFYSPGIDYSYSTSIGHSKRVRLQFSIGLGYIHSQGRTYTVFEDYGQLYPDEGTVMWNYFGPTKAAVSIVVPFFRKEGRR